MSDLTDRIAALEATIADLPLASLPLGALQRRLENDWQPDASLLLQPNSINVDALASGIKPQGGKATLAWPGGSAGSTALTVKHTLGVVPVVVVSASASSGLTAIPSIQAFNITATSFDVGATTVDAQLPLITATTAFHWIALG